MIKTRKYIFKMFFFVVDDLIDSYNFKEQFCTLFNIENLADIIKTIVNVDNPKPAEDLLHFYSHSIELIQHFLFVNGFLSETRSSYLQTIFAEMNFVSVECIYLSYQYKENLVRKSSSSNPSSYINESNRIFYVLEKSDNYHIDTMVNYIILDVPARTKLSQYIKILFKIYQKEGIQELIKEQEKLPEEKVIKWFIPRVIKKELTEEVQEEEESNDQSVIVPDEMIEKMKNEPAWELPERKNNMPIDPNQPKGLTSFPPNIGAVGGIKSSDIPQSSESKLPSTVGSNENNLHSSVSTSVTSIDEKKTVEQQVNLVSNTVPLTISNFITTSSQVNFEQIHISNFADIPLSSQISPNPPINTNNSSSNKETDITTGRHGEEFVYRYLLWKYPKAQIRWNNQQEESGQPFDIEMIRQETKNQRELIEVKTTRILKQNTFQISVSEVECLLANQENYYIYRVYYDNDEKSSTITILSRIKCHLQQKQLALSITIAENSN